MTTYYFVGSGNWHSSSSWSLTSGGSGGAGIPGSTDYAIFDANSGSSATLTSNVTVGRLDMSNWGPWPAARTFNMGSYSLTITGSGSVLLATNNIAANISGTSNIYLTNSTSTAIYVSWFPVPNDYKSASNLYCTSGNFGADIGGIFNNVDFYNGGSSTYSGSLQSYDGLVFFGTLTFNTVASGMTIAGYATYLIAGGTNSTIVSNGQQVNAYTYVQSYGQPNPTLTLSDALYASSMQLITGSASLVFNGKNLTTGSFSSTSASQGTVSFGSGNPTMAISGSSSFGSVTVTGQGTAAISTYGSYGSLTISCSSSNKIPATIVQGNTTQITVSGGSYLNIRNTAYGTVKFTGPVRFVDFNLKGTSGTPLTVQGTASNTSVFKVDPWYVGPNSTDAGGNTNIIFSGAEGSDYLTVSNLSGTYDYGPHFMMFA